MKFTSPVYSAVSGSIAGITYSSNGGLIARARAIPANPNSALQQNIRTAMGAAAAGWSVLTTAQQGAWNDYADATPTQDKLGNTITLSGFNMYARWASLRGTIGGSISLATPPTSGLGNPPGAITAEATTDTITVAITGTGASQDGDMIVYRSGLLGLGQNSQRRPLFRIGTAAVAQDDTSVVITSGENYTAADRYVLRARLVYDTGEVPQACTEVVTIAT